MANTGEIIFADTEEIYDYVFIGLGCANSLMIIELFNKGLLENKRILIFESESKSVNDRTFCFWMQPNELEQSGISQLVSYSWKKWRVNAEVSDIYPFAYQYIRSIDLYNYVRDILQNTACTRISSNYLGNPFSRNGLLELDLGNHQLFYARWVFDSRPVQFECRTKMDTHLVQSFLGWEIQSQIPCFDAEVFQLMDFTIDQDETTQFMYVLPFSDTRALIEVTRFDKAPIAAEDAERILHKYIHEITSNYEVLATEQGRIPMCSGSLQVKENPKRWIDTGSRAGQVKPSTGYSFVRSLQHAKQIVEAILSDKLPKQKKQLNRFNLYDSLLLQLLSEKPSMGKLIFSRLFNRNSSTTILSFLDENSTLGEEIKLFMQFPISLFVLASFKRVFFGLKNLLRVIPISYWVTTLLIVLQNLELTNVSILLLLLGLFVYGIPHGALDHLLLLSNRSAKSLVQFSLTYLFIGGGIYALFYFFPTSALLLFLCYSAYHFGQTDFEHWSIPARVLNFFWGAYVLAALLLAHFDEAVFVINDMGVSFLDGYALNISTAYLFIVGFGLPLFFVLLNTHILKTILLLMLLTHLPLLFAFGVYFIFHHSLHGWAELKHHLSLTSYSLWIRSLPFTLGSVFLFILLYWTNVQIQWGQLFIFLAALSFPHVALTYFFYYVRIKKIN